MNTRRVESSIDARPDLATLERLDVEYGAPERRAPRPHPKIVEQAVDFIPQRATVMARDATSGFRLIAFVLHGEFGDCLCRGIMRGLQMSASWPPSWTGLFPHQLFFAFSPPTPIAAVGADAPIAAGVVARRDVPEGSLFRPDGEIGPIDPTGAAAHEAGAMHRVVTLHGGRFAMFRNDLWPHVGTDGFDMTRLRER